VNRPSRDSQRLPGLFPPDGNSLYQFLVSLPW
jgi:hypothetical protein